jgi:nucleoside-diphosphate-sugar epimerase
MDSGLVCAISGSTGYVGSTLAAVLSSQMNVVGLARRPDGENTIQWEFNSNRVITDQLQARGVNVLIHAAWDMHASTMKELQSTCVAGSERLYTMASQAGIKRFIFISTISAFEGCRSAYGRSKLEVERMTREIGGIVLRPGLIHGPTPGGVFGAIRNQVRKSSVIPLTGTGRAPQYLLHESTLAQAVLRAVAGDFDSSAGEPLTIAHPKPWPFRELVLNIARAEDRNVTFLPVPWPFLYSSLRVSEMFGLRLPIRSDSVISFVYQNPEPDFSKLRDYGINPVPFS